MTDEEAHRQVIHAILYLVQVVGYMGVPYYGGDMVSHPQFLTVRNARGSEMLDLVRPRLEVMHTMSAGSRTQFVMQTVEADDK